MQPKQIERIKAEIKDKMQQGDYITLGRMLNVSRFAATGQYHRCNKKAVQAMKMIVDNREKLITKYQSK